MVEFRKYKQFSRLVQEVVVVKVLKRYDTNKTNHNLQIDHIIGNRYKNIAAYIYL